MPLYIAADATASIQRHNYLILQVALIEGGDWPIRPGEVTHVSWQHDDHCGLYLGSRCDCSPDLIVSDDYDYVADAPVRGRRIKIPYRYKRLLRKPTTQ